MKHGMAKKISFSLAAAVAAAAGMFACTEVKDGPADSMGRYKSFIHLYVDTEKLVCGQAADGNYIRVGFVGENHTYSDPAEGRFKELSERYGDTCYNREIVRGAIHAMADEFTAVDIVSDRDFDAGHRAGESLAGIARLVTATPLRFIESGYTDLYRWTDSDLQDYRQIGLTFWDTHFPVNKPLTELTPRDLLLLDDYGVYLRFTAEPQEKEQTFTVTFRNAEKEVSGTVGMSFE